ncbi:MAG: hypothetical protein AB8B88_04480 [Devosiaceae bacterium]
MGAIEWSFADFKGSLFILVFGFVFIALFWQLYSVEKTIKARKTKEAEKIINTPLN